MVINFHWICSIMKIHLIFCVTTQIPYPKSHGKILFLRHRQKKCCQPIKLEEFRMDVVENGHGHGLLVHKTLKYAVSKNDFMNWADFLMLIVMQWFLVRLISYSLTFKCWGTTAVVLVTFDRAFINVNVHLPFFINVYWLWLLHHFKGSKNPRNNLFHIM